MTPPNWYRNACWDEFIDYCNENNLYYIEEDFDAFVDNAWLNYLDSAFLD